MRAYDVIHKKKHNKELNTEEINFIVSGFTAGTVSDAQMTALLMAIYFRGMTTAETIALTMAMARSGNQMDLSPLAGIKVDKHSTGGVG
ncbi:MAG: pyrimidine-nucleoside phosphorylase, partial [Defluviitaleaceae bacterium]|nr:pyrimidine-nucleoside phosphorylase [Defluviitaleaceae bacterium]